MQIADFLGPDNRLSSALHKGVNLMNDNINDILGGNAVSLAIALLVIVALYKAVKIVPQSEKHVVERFGRLRTVLGPGINFIIPFLDVVAHRISVLERQLPNAEQDAITSDNVLVKVETSVFYRITEPEKTVYRIRDVDGAIATTVAGIVRSEIGKIELDQVQSNRADLINKIREQVVAMVDDWGIEVTRAEILDVNLDAATRSAMLQQLNAERARRAQVTEAEGRKRAVELAADADLYAAEQMAKARRVEADAEAYATGVVAAAIKENGLEAAQYQVALKQVEALQAVATGDGKQTILLPAAALEAFGNAFGLLKGKG
jgi:regulator of protease activity HflC (stomatin/prohibitin superfamily)